jgi:hypothetical protein
MMRKLLLELGLDANASLTPHFSTLFRVVVQGVEISHLAYHDKDLFLCPLNFCRNCLLFIFIIKDWSGGFKGHGRTCLPRLRLIMKAIPAKV